MNKKQKEYKNLLIEYFICKIKSNKHERDLNVHNIRLTN